MPEVTCNQCGKVFNKPACHIARVKNVFCGKDCRQAFQRVPVTKTCKVCGDSFTVRPCEAHQFSTCPKPECRLTAKQKDNNPNWRGGVTGRRKAEMSLMEYRKWRRAVLKRDGNTCQKCGKNTGTLHAHHILPYAYYPALRYDVSNGMTLCVDCHKTTYKDAFLHRP